MFLTEIIPMTEQQRPGTYIGVRFCKETVKQLKQYIKDNNIPNGLRSDHFHSTVIYSRKHLPGYDTSGVKYDPPLVGHPSHLEVWDTSGETPSKCLVLVYECTALVERHQALRAEHDAPHDFDDYITHISLSYDIADLDWTTLPDVALAIGQIKVAEEYHEELNPYWATDNG